MFSVIWAKFHVVSQLGDALRCIVHIGAAVVVHDVGIPSGSGGRIVNRAAFVAEESAVVVLVDHLLILFISIKCTGWLLGFKSVARDKLNSFLKFQRKWI